MGGSRRAGEKHSRDSGWQAILAVKIVNEMPKVRHHAVRFLAESNQDERVLRRIFAVLHSDQVLRARVERHAAAEWNELVLEELET